MKQSKQHTPERHVIDLFAKRWENHDKNVLRCTLLAMLSGISPRTETMENDFSVSKGQVGKAYSTDRYDLDSSGRVVNVFGVSTTEQRPFSVSQDSVSLSVCCALVSSMISLLTLQPTTVRSRDPISGREVVVALSKSAVNASPKSSVAVLVRPTEKEFCADPWNSFCKYVRMYEYESNIPAGLNPAAILTIEQLRDLALELLQSFFWLEKEIV